MKFIWNLIVALVLFLPSVSLAENVTVPQDSVDKETIVLDSLASCKFAYANKKGIFSFLYPEGFYPRLWGVAVGGGRGMFSAGADMIFGLSSVIYETAKPDTMLSFFWEPTHVLMWTNRIRMIYDYDNHQYGFFFQPNLRYLFKTMYASLTIGPEVGWETKTGFEYGASIRIGGALALLAGNYEIGYLVNSQRFYFTISFCISALFLVAASI